MRSEEQYARDRNEMIRVVHDGEGIGKCQAEDREGIDGIAA